jgi:hypothetical protein
MNNPASKARELKFISSHLNITLIFAVASIRVA